MTSSTTTPLATTLSDAVDRIDPGTALQTVGSLSVALGALAVVAPVRTASAFGVRSTGGALPLLVRMVGVRNAVGGLRTLQAADGDDRKAALQAGLVLGAVDVTAVLLAARAGAISKKAAVGAVVVLGGIAVLGVAAGRD